MLSPLADRAAPPDARSAGHRIVRATELQVTPHWDDNLQVMVLRDGLPVFACVVRRGPTGGCTISDCLPQLDAPEPASNLELVCDHLVSELGLTDVVAVHPDFWTAQLAAAGATPQRSVVPMVLRLDPEHLAMHARLLPDGLSIEQLDHSGRPTDLTERWFAGDRADGLFGPQVREASLVASSTDRIVAATDVTCSAGSPLLVHCVVVDDQRGRGIGVALLVESMARLAAAGYTDCRLHVDADDWRARRMFRSIGFVQNGPVHRTSTLRSVGRG